VGLAVRRWFDLPMVVLANVLVDVEVLFANGYPHHQVWHFHTLLVGGLVGAACGAAVYPIKPIRLLFEAVMRLVHIPYKARPVKMALGGMLGAWLHVIVDACYHHDVQLFWPMETNPLYGWVHWEYMQLTSRDIELICIMFFVPAAVLYVLAVWSSARQDRRKKRMQ
jgi:hypothetical protein